MICVVIKGPTYEEAHQQISSALLYTRLVELRLDCFQSLDLVALKNLCSSFACSFIFTLRSQNQGGNYTQSEENRLADIRRLVTLKPEYFDIEYHVPEHFINEITSQYPKIDLILSYHNFTETPEDLDKIFREMQKIPACTYKIAVSAKSCLDAMRFICWSLKSNGNLIPISMGSHGQISRILGPMSGCPITYASLEDDQKTAPGQLSAKTLIERYYLPYLTPRTAIYGLIGDPVDGSISDETHNSLITACGLDAVYVKIQVVPSELSKFLQYAKQLGFQGLSVTMPLKEHALACLDEIDPQALAIGAVNTLVFKEERVIGFNTDGIGALNAIEEVYQGKGRRMVIIGAGGAAKAIAYEAHKRGYLVTALNRDESKASEIAESLGCIGKGLDQIAECAEIGYDILINCTPASQPIESEYVLPSAIFMDIRTKPRETVFLKLAKGKGCTVVYGYRMFVEQALGQFQLWFKDRIDLKECRRILEEKSIECL